MVVWGRSAPAGHRKIIKLIFQASQRVQNVNHCFVLPVATVRASIGQSTDLECPKRALLTSLEVARGIRTRHSGECRGYLDRVSSTLVRALARRTHIWAVFHRICSSCSYISAHVVPMCHVRRSRSPAPLKACLPIAACLAGLRSYGCSLTALRGLWTFRRGDCGHARVLLCCAPKIGRPGTNFIDAKPYLRSFANGFACGGNG